MNYYELLLQALYHQVELHRWSLERLHSKARTTITAGTAALSVITVGLSGFAALLAGGGHGHVELLESLFDGLARHVIGISIAGIACIIVSLGMSVIALKGHDLYQILTSEEFEWKPKGGTSGETKKPEVSEDALCSRLVRNIHLSVMSFEAYNVKIAPMVRWGQRLLLTGIGLITAVPLVALIRLLFS